METDMESFDLYFQSMNERHPHDSRSYRDILEKYSLNNGGNHHFAANFDLPAGQQVTVESNYDAILRRDNEAKAMQQRESFEEVINRSTMVITPEVKNEGGGKNARSRPLNHKRTSKKKTRRNRKH